MLKFNNHGQFGVLHDSGGVIVVNVNRPVNTDDPENPIVMSMITKVFSPPGVSWRIGTNLKEGDVTILDLAAGDHEIETYPA